MPKPVSYAQWSLEPYCIGMKLRALRTRKRMTLARLAAETGLSTALLSKLETERMIPTLPTLTTICRVYGVGLGHFFTEPTRHSLSVTRRAHLKANTRTLETAAAFPLNSLADNPALTAEMVELTGMPFGLAESGTEICVFLHVLEGTLQLMTDGMAQKMEAGDCAYLETRMPTALTADGSQRCRILLIKPSPAIAFKSAKGVIETSDGQGGICTTLDGSL